MTGRVCFVAVCLVAGATASHNNSGINTRTHGPVRSCSDIEFTSDRELAQAAQTLTISQNVRLDLDAAPNGGAQVWGGSGNEFRITACKAAVADSPADAQARLGEINVTASGGNVRTSSPADEGNWTVYYIIETPPHAAMTLNARNGPLGFDSVEGTIEATAINGPIAIKNCRGNISVETINGPIALDGGGGTIRMHAQNGPLAVHLTGLSWGAGGVNASAVNGPLALKLPANYQSAVRIETSDHSPIQCQAPQCHDAQVNWEAPRQINLGSGEPVIRMSTVNGPVSISSERHSDED